MTPDGVLLANAREATSTMVVRLANAAAAFAMAAVAGSVLWYASVLWSPGGYGDFGLTVGDFALPADSGSWIVTSIVPGYPAEKAGVKLGDRVSTALPVHDRLTLTGQIAPHPDEGVTLRAFRRDHGRTLTFKARPLAPLPAIDSVFLAFQIVVNVIFVTVGLVLVLLRPTRMTWGFCLLAVAFAGATFPHSTLYPISYLPTGWLVAAGVVEDILTAAGAVGFLVFCLRFPTNAPIGWRKQIDRLTPYLAAVLAAVIVSTDLGRWFFIVPAGVTRGMWNAWLAGCIAIASGAPIILLTAYRNAPGAERARMKWVILGLVCTSAALVGIFLSWGGPLSGLPIAFVWILCLLVAALPLTVAYAVIRHRVIDVRFVISRSLAVGTVAAIIGLIVIGIDWLFTTKVPTSRFETATYFGVALLIGLTLNAVRQRISRTIDFFFFRERSRTQERVDIIAGAIRRASFKENLYEPLTAGVARAFSLASAALFERATDGGFGRVAADGWPAGTLWNILSDDPLVVRADGRPRVAEIDPFQWHERRLPSGVAMPAVMVPIVAGRRVLAILLCGAHTNGAGLDPDEARSIRILAADAALVYGESATPNWEQDALMVQPRAALT